MGVRVAQFVENTNTCPLKPQRGEGIRRVGAISEDVPDLVVRNDKKGLTTMDFVAVLTQRLLNNSRG